MLFHVLSAVDLAPCGPSGCTLFLGTWPGFLQRLGTCGGWDRAAWLGVTRGQRLLPQLGEWHSATCAHT